MDFLNNTNIVVAIGFVIFVGILVYFGVPGMLTRALDARAVRIKAELAEALRREGGRDVDGWIAVLRDGGLAAYDAFRREPSEVEAEAFGAFPHADSQTHRQRGDCAPRIGAATRLRLGLGLGDPSYAGHWPEASVRRGGGKLGDTIFALKRLRRRLAGDGLSPRRGERGG